MSARETVGSVCQSCKFAEWDRTSNGRRHPNGNGKCLFELPDLPLPKWFGERSYGRDNAPLTTLREYFAQRQPVRSISWLDYHRVEPKQCATWESAK